MLKKHAVFYAACHWDTTIGIFDCAQKAQAASHYIREIPAMMLEGTTPKEGFLVYITARWDYVVSTPERRRETSIDLAPVLGVNAQSAVAAILKGRQGGHVRPQSILLYEINRIYSPDERRAPGVRAEFMPLFRPFITGENLDEEFFATDFIGAYLARAEENRQYREKRRQMESSKEVQLLAEHLYTSGIEKPPRCGFAASKQLERITRCLIHFFTMEELQTAAHIRGLVQNSAVEAAIEKGEITKEQLIAMEDRLREIEKRIIH